MLSIHSTYKVDSVLSFTVKSGGQILWKVFVLLIKLLVSGKRQKTVRNVNSGTLMGTGMSVQT